MKVRSRRSGRWARWCSLRSGRGTWEVPPPRDTASKEGGPGVAHQKPTVPAAEGAATSPGPGGHGGPGPGRRGRRRLGAGHRPRHPGDAAPARPRRQRCRHRRRLPLGAEPPPPSPAPGRVAGPAPADRALAALGGGAARAGSARSSRRASPRSWCSPTPPRAAPLVVRVREGRTTETSEPLDSDLLGDVYSVIVPSNLSLILHGGGAEPGHHHPGPARPARRGHGGARGGGAHPRQRPGGPAARCAARLRRRGPPPAGGARTPGGRHRGEGPAR